eukprot:TRINITY_DN23002_c0_g1_i1.p1 TRINITY_DN23002_c0_g1~~TRINITY_DN23002_c0_g1_i1.p1  ORF type:complete len:749 (-),score=55.99 TRINITY_DN23002_c0_g1_i1:475-2721(-)
MRWAVHGLAGLLRGFCFFLKVLAKAIPIGVLGAFLVYLFDTDFRPLQVVWACEHPDSTVHAVQVWHQPAQPFNLTTPMGHQIEMTPSRMESIPFGVTCWAYVTCKVTRSSSHGIPQEIGWRKEWHFPSPGRTPLPSSPTTLGCGPNQHVPHLLEEVAKRTASGELGDWLERIWVDTTMPFENIWDLNDVAIWQNSKLWLIDDVSSRIRENIRLSGQVPQTCSKVREDPVDLRQVRFFQFAADVPAITVAGVTLPSGFEAVLMEEGNLSQVAQLKKCRDFIAVAGRVPGLRTVLFAIASTHANHILPVSLLALIAVLVSRADPASGLKVSALLLSLWLKVDWFSMRSLLILALVAGVLGSMRVHEAVSTSSRDFFRALAERVWQLVALSAAWQLPFRRTRQGATPGSTVCTHGVLDIGEWHSNSTLGMLELWDMCAFRTCCSRACQCCAAHLTVQYPSMPNLDAMRMACTAKSAACYMLLKPSRMRVALQVIWLLSFELFQPEKMVSPFHYKSLLVQYLFWGPLLAQVLCMVGQVDGMRAACRWFPAVTAEEAMGHWWTLQASSRAAAEVAGWVILAVTAYAAATVRIVEELAGGYEIVPLPGAITRRTLAFGGCATAAMLFKLSASGIEVSSVQSALIASAIAAHAGPSCLQSGGAIAAGWLCLVHTAVAFASYGWRSLLLTGVFCCQFTPGCFLVGWALLAAYAQQPVAVDEPLPETFRMTARWIGQELVCSVRDFLHLTAATAVPE